MTYQPPANASLWQAFLSDQDGYLTTAAEALDEYGPESHVEVSIRCLSALPIAQTIGAPDGVWKLPGSTDEGDIAVTWTLDMVDDLGETDHIDRQLKAAQAMAAGLNGALANAGDWNRGTELAATLHDLADKLAVYDGAIPALKWMTFHFYSSQANDHVADVDQLANALLGFPGKLKKRSSGSWEHRAEAPKLPGGIDVAINVDAKAPADEDPDVLKARIAELEAKLAGGVQ